MKIFAKLMKMRNLVHPSKKVEIKQILKLSYPSQIFINFEKVSEFLESILNELQDSHLNSSNPLRSDKATWVFNHTIKSLKLVISIVNFQMAIT